jgi:hypothetical protein
MASASLGTAVGIGPGRLLAACVEAQGSAAHPWPASPALLKGDARALADAVHFLCILHGRYPGVVDHAAARTLDPAARAWLTQASYAFAGERAYLARLAVAAGPVPSTPGAADSDNVVLAQRHAIDMLASSERNGCALGAAMAVVLDWRAIRFVLDAAAARFGLEAPLCAVPSEAVVESVAERFADSPGARRALLFGAEQILVQHFGLWDLLETRHQARAAAA